MPAWRTDTQQVQRPPGALEELPPKKERDDVISGDVISGCVWLKCAQAHKLYGEESFCHLLKHPKGALDQIHFDFYVFLVLLLHFCSTFHNSLSGYSQL